MKSIAIISLEEVSYGTLDKGNRQPTRYIVRGAKMYTTRIETMIDIFTKDEFKAVIRMFEMSDMFSYANVLKRPFKSITEGMKPVARSRLKKKMIENKIMIEYCGKLWISPFVLIPRNDKNIHNFQHLVQRSWLYINEDKNKFFDGIEEFINHSILGNDNV